MLRVLAFVFVGAVAMAGTPSPTSAAVTVNGPCDRTSWVAGTVDLCEGALVYRDYVYDDYGADLGTPASQTASRTGSLALPAGDVRYRGVPNTADLVDLTIRVDGDELEVIFELNALFEPDSTLAVLAIDTDDDRATGGGIWDPLPIRSDGWDELHVFDRGDPESNLISGRIPRPTGDRWRLQAATAEVGGEVMNVAFRGPDEEAKADVDSMYAGAVGVWFEDLQARALASGDVSEFGHVVEVADLDGGVTRGATVGPGLHSRVYTSDYTLPPGEGMTYEGIPGRGDGSQVPLYNQIFQFYGRYQPYGIYIPDQPGPHGVQFIYHGSNTPHASLINQPGVQADLGEALNRVLVVPLARGPHGYGSDISERDVLDVHADVLANLDVDPERVFAGGYSQGGYIAFRMASLHPHLFAGFITWVGFTGDAGNVPGTSAGEDIVTAGAVGNVRHLVRNLRHVPGAMVFGGADELIHVTSSQAMAQEFRDRDFEYVHFFHPTGDHFTFAALDEWSKEAEWSRGRVRVEDPPRVVFRTADVLGNADYDIRHDRAYWVSEIRPRGAGYADLDVTSFGCGGSVPTVESSVGAGPLPVPWVSDANVVVGLEALDRTPVLDANLVNVASMTIDVDASCLAGESVRYRVVTDGATTVRLSDGREFALADAGEHDGVVAVAAAPEPDPTPEATAAMDGASGDGGPSLPATGNAWPVAQMAVFLLAASSLLSGSRRRPSRAGRVP